MFLFDKFSDVNVVPTAQGPTPVSFPISPDVYECMSFPLKSVLLDSFLFQCFHFLIFIKQTFFLKNFLLKYVTLINYLPNT